MQQLTPLSLLPRPPPLPSLPSLPFLPSLPSLPPSRGIIIIIIIRTFWMHEELVEADWRLHTLFASLIR